MAAATEYPRPYVRLEPKAGASDLPWTVLFKEVEDVERGRFAHVRDAMRHAELLDRCARTGWTELCHVCYGSHPFTPNCPRCEGSGLELRRPTMTSLSEYVGPAPEGFWNGMRLDLVLWEVI